ncbi:winged helix-turn-helix domain-containing protein [Natrinema sp. DC36]|uniref:winged helix-turn-helix domain-containing protein n=1 Tax=Natrinema sp. DC36 TaxID=2878680 RepID=UPI001CF040B9|nr:winged helix-turn-helix domain-containing protein [Natrinema sp. DC36]
MADPCRRSILTQLIDSEATTVPADTLVDRISPEIPSSETAATHADSLLVDVHHIHLPKLEEANLIEYDPRTKTIRYSPNGRVERVLQFVTEELE